MPIEVSWGNPEKTIILSKFVGNWTMEDYHAMIDTMYPMVSSVDHPVHYVTDFSASTSSPAKLLSAGRHMENTSSNSNARAGISVAVKASGFIKAMSGVVQKLFLKNTQMYFADTVDEAYRMIEKHEQKTASGQKTSGQK